MVWQKGLKLVRQVYQITRDGKLSKDFNLRDQLRGAAISITSNIAEGFERASRKEYLNFLNIAKGSAGELRSLWLVTAEIGYLEEPQFYEMHEMILEVSRFLSNQMKSLKKLPIKKPVT